MNQTSSGQTGVVGGIGAALIAVLDWILNTKLALQVPAVVLGSMSAVILAAVHQASNLIAAKQGELPVISATPTAKDAS